MLKRLLTGLFIALQSASIGLPAQAEESKSPILVFDDGIDYSATVELSLSKTTERTKSASAPPKKARVCQDPLDGRIIACNLGGVWWDTGRQCYVSLASPQPDFSHCAWRGNTGGVIFACKYPASSAGYEGMVGV